jgi:hypothetical protein
MTASSRDDCAWASLNATSPLGPDVPHVEFVCVVTNGVEAQDSTKAATKLE